MIVSKKVYFIVLFFVLSTNFLKSMENGELSIQTISDFLYDSLSFEEIKGVVGFALDSKSVTSQNSPNGDSGKKPKKTYQKKIRRLYTDITDIQDLKRKVQCGLDGCIQQISYRQKRTLIQNFLSHVAINHFDTNIPDIKQMEDNSYCVECPKCHIIFKNNFQRGIKNSYRRHVLIAHNPELKKNCRKYINNKAE